MRLALLGDPVEHSRSPAMHRAALAAIGVEGSYEARRTDHAGVQEAVREIRAGRLDGANITMPLKQAALDACDTASLEAIRAGAVNTLFLHDGAVRGENTDIGAVSDLWQRCGLPDGPVHLLGAGGAAGAVLVALEGREVVVSARSREAAHRLIAATGVDATVADWGAAVPGAVVVNATPLGMQGEDLPAGLLEGAAGLYDLAYGPVDTPAAALLRGSVPVVDGLDHLVAQAARSFTLWTGQPAPIDVMDLAARR